MGVYFNIKCKVVLEDFFLSYLIIEESLKYVCTYWKKEVRQRGGKAVDRDGVRTVVLC